ncbi:MAG: efflux RND transporter permease subunit [Gemmatimonadaceae bacterium]
MTLFDLLRSERRFVYLSIAGLSAGGIWAATRLPSAIYPEVAFPRITIVAEGSSLGTRQVVFGITRPIEEALSTVPGLERVRTRSIRGASEVSAYFTPKTDMIYTLQLVQTRVNQIRSQLPADVDIEVERLTPSLFPIVQYNLEGGDPATLNDIGRYQIRPIISRVPGVGRVDVQATDVREIEVVADPARLAAAGLGYDDVASAIKQTISVDAVGRVARDYKQFLVVTDQEAHTVDDIANVVVRPGLRVRDIASVFMGTQDRTRVVAGDGRPAALINIARQIGGNTVSIADSVARAMAEIGKSLPPGVHLKAVYDQATLVRDSVRSVRDAMLIGALLAVIVLFAFLGQGTITAVSAASIPLTLAITVFIMRLTGQTFNLMSLGAMAIAIGLVIDDAVVVVENVARHLALTPERDQAVRDAMRELIWPVTTSTITTVVVFLPLGLLQGVVGQFFAALAITLTIAVLVSLVIALSVIPLMAARFIQPHVEGQGKVSLFRRIGRAIDGLPPRYERTLASVLHHPRRVGAAALLLIIAGYFASRFIGTGFLPVMDEGAFVLDYFAPSGTALAETDRQVNTIERILARTPEITGTSRRLGAELGLFATQQNRGDIVARLAPHRDRSRDIFAVMAEVREKVGVAVPRIRVEFVEILSDVINDLAGAPKPVEIKLFGERLDILEGYAKQLAPPLEKIDGLVDVYDGVAEPNAEMLLQVKGAEAARVGLTPQQVGEQLRGAMLGVPAGEVRRDDRAIAVRVRASDSVRYDALRLADLPLVGASHQLVPLGSVATVRDELSRSELYRENQRQMIAITGEVEKRSLGGVMTDVKRVLATHPPPAGVRLELGGQYASQQDAFRALLSVLALAALSVVAVMVIQFRSFIEPLVILLAAPVSFVGAIVLLWVTGTPLNVSSFMGLILLVGLIVKNGIILLDFTRHRMLEAGLALEEAIRDAARTRLRPILMTTLCTLFGLLPLALGIGAGSEMQRPLAIAVIGGLALSTPITLYIVPTLIVAVRGREFRMPSDQPSSAASSPTAAEPSGM